MRSNLEDNNAFRLRHFATKRPSIQSVLVGTFIIPVNGPEIYMFDAGSATRNIILPSLVEEFSVLIANIGASNTLDVYNSLNVLQTTVRPSEVKYFFSSSQRWVWLRGSFTDDDDATGMTDELRQVTAAGAQVITAIEAGLVINKAVASTTPVALPTTASRLGKPIRLVDWGGNVSAANPVTVTPDGAEKIMNQANWVFEGLSFGGVLLFPHTGLGGWTIGG